jgi:hypothetical protein
MDKNAIFLQEAANDGQTIFLYYDGMSGVYLAYGLSAFYTTLVTEPYLSFSDEMQMPVAILTKKHVLYLHQSLHTEEHVVKSFYRFKLKTLVGDAGYEKWLQKIMAK